MKAELVRCLEAGEDIQRFEVESEVFYGTAVNYPQLTGEAQVGDEVLLNTTAVELALGTGGVHFVISNLSRRSAPVHAVGHIMKLRYTPMQTNVTCIEEDDHPQHRWVADFSSLDGKPIVLAMLHSMIAPAAAGVQATFEERCGRRARIVYLMTDSAALPLAFSHLVRELKERGIIHTTVTCGQAFGGDVEAVNIYTALMASSAADVVIVAPGPGHVGTGTSFGFSGIEQGHHIDVVNQLGGEAVVIPRISFADPRERHRGLSHHTATVLTRACQTRSTVVLPQLPDDRAKQIDEELRKQRVGDRHTIVKETGETAVAYMKDHSLDVKSMGRSAVHDPAYFLAAGAAGVYAAKHLLCMKVGL